MKSRQFENGLIVKHRKAAVILENSANPSSENVKLTYSLYTGCFAEFVHHIETAASEAWSDVTPKNADSLGSDYAEYYDRKYDNNGYLAITKNGIEVSPPYGSLDTLYQFNKAKIQSFIYDLRKSLVTE